MICHFADFCRIKSRLIILDVQGWFHRSRARRPWRESPGQIDHHRNLGAKCPSRCAETANGSMPVMMMSAAA